MTTELIVAVDKVLYPPPSKESDFKILLTDMGKCKGEMSWTPREGEQLKMVGEWEIYRGERQFKFKTTMPNVPEDPHAMLIYVCERVKGVGPKMAEAIWEKFGEEWDDATESSVPRLTGAKYDAFDEARNAVTREKEKSQAIAYILSKGGTVVMANTAWDEWMKDTIPVVESDCYSLTKLPRYGFQNVDLAIRHHFGIEDLDPRRVRAAIEYAMRQALRDGSTITTWDILRDETARLIGAHYQIIADQTKVMLDTGILAGFPQVQMLCLSEDYKNESTIWRWAKHAA